MDDVSKPDEPSVPDGISKGFLSVLNRHGYGFQNAVLERCLSCAGVFPWKEAVLEYSLTLNGRETHADFVLGSGTHLLGAECKRANGWRWGFVRSGGSSWTLNQRPRADYLGWRGQPNTLHREVRWFGPPNQRLYDVCVGEARGKGVRPCAYTSDACPRRRD
jgi:hypothetical protein